jgi:uncharacterized protein (DUF2147 family)
MLKAPVLVAPAFALVAFAAPAFAVSPAEGLWRTPTREAQVQIYECGQALCGKLVTSAGLKADPNLKDVNNKDASLRGRPMKDLVMLQGFTGGPTQWKGGSVYNGEDGGTYKGTIKMLNADQHKLTGCIIFPLCKTQVWNRVK